MAETTPPTPGGSTAQGQDDIDALLAAAQQAPDPNAPTAGGDATLPQSQQDEIDAAFAAADAAKAPASAQDSIDDLLKSASFEDPSAVEPAVAAPDAQAVELPNFSQVMQDAQVSSIDLLKDVELNVKIELGRSRMLVEDVLKLSEGSVVELDKLAGDPVDVFVNDRLVARGEVLVLNDNFCVRVNEIVAGAKEEGM
ncbi:MAG TPA: flagellar motor switch protein FliN [Tepidisphaeraceae bacterium]|nr:flagellar motor switch protein FliN [Tepidisphaeraceae bacterium]